MGTFLLETVDEDEDKMKGADGETLRCSQHASREDISTADLLLNIVAHLCVSEHKCGDYTSLSRWGGGQSRRL